MRKISTILLPFVIFFLLNSFAFAISERCLEIEQKAGLDLNEAECYVLRQVENGKIADLRFRRKHKDVLKPLFLIRLLTGSIPGLKIKESGIRVSSGRVMEPLILKRADIPFPVQLKYFDFEQEVDFQKTLFSEADFSFSEFQDKTSLFDAQFLGAANFDRVSFNKYISFNRAIFTKEANFFSVRFADDNNFKNAQFFENANFREGEFLRGANFDDSIFFKKADFSSVKFYSWALFRSSRFFEKADFSSAKILDWSSFTGIKFLGEIDFSSVLFSKKSDFTEANFTGKAEFSKSQFSDIAKFNYTVFSSVADFSGVTFSSMVDFSSSDLKSKTNFKLALFNDTLIFDDVSGFSKMVVEWKYSPDKFKPEDKGENIKRRGLKNHLKYNKTFYIALIKNYREMGWFLEADDCYYTYRVEKRKRRPLWAGIGL